MVSAEPFGIRPGPLTLNQPNEGSPISPLAAALKGSGQSLQQREHEDFLHLPKALFPVDGGSVVERSKSQELNAA